MWHNDDTNVLVHYNVPQYWLVIGLIGNLFDFFNSKNVKGDEAEQLQEALCSREDQSDANEEWEIVSCAHRSVKSFSTQFVKEH